jgi:hypothetical protein
MPTTVQFRRGTSTQNDAFTGGAGEVSFDTTNKTLRAHDGATAGGSRLAKYSEVNANLANTNAYIASTQGNIDTLTGTVNSNLANTNAYIASTQGNIDTLTGTVNSNLANTNAYIASNYTTLWSALTSTNTSIRSSISTEVSNLVNSAPATLDTLNELAAALGDDANFASTVTSSLALKANTSSLATVATTGAYSDLTGTPAAVVPGGSFEAVASGSLANGDKVVVNADGTVASVVSQAGGALLQTLDNPNAYGTSADDRFGRSVAISGNYAIVGASYEDDADGDKSGKAYIYNNSTGALLHTLDNPNPYSTSGNDYFGEAVAISGTYAIVGAVGEDEAGNPGSGKAYIFDVTTGALVHTLDNPNAYGTREDDFFGRSVAISGNYAIVGANGEDDAGGSNAGKAYIFNVTSGALLHTLNNPNAYGESASDYFGEAVAISDTYAIVGAYGEADASGTYSGKAYIFNVSTGALVHTLNNPNPYGTSQSDFFGISVAITDTYAIVGAHQEDDAGVLGSGKAYIYNVSTGALLYTLDNPNAYGTSANDRFGESVAISGNYAIVGASYEDDADGTQSGKAYIYNVSTGALLYTLDNPNAYGTSGDDNFSLPVAISGNYAIVGAFLEDDAGGGQSGKAYIFSTVNTTNLTTENFVGIADGAYASGATATIQTAGAVDDAQSGLTAGQAYFLQEDGTLGTTADTTRVFAGVALSATELMIGRDMSSAAVVPYTDSDVATYLSGNGYDTATNIISTITDSAPATLDTLNELAAALGDDANFSTTITNSLATKYDAADFDSDFDTRLALKDTGDLAEGTNLYYTDARARAAISGGTGISYNSTTGVIGVTATGDITGVTAGNGLTGGGASGDVTLNIGAGAGISVAADSISVESDLRGDVFYIGQDTNDYIHVNTTVIDFRLDGNLDMRLENDGDLHADGDVIAFSTTTSDSMFKDNVVTIENGLEKVCSLRGVEFDWNATSRKGQHDIGVIAQEVETVIPHIVKEKTLVTGEFADNPVTAKTVDYEKLTAVLIEAIKEQQEQISVLTHRVNALESR